MVPGAGPQMICQERPLSHGPVLALDQPRSSWFESVALARRRHLDLARLSNHGDVREQWISTEHSQGLRGRRSTNTEPEVLLRRALHALGARFCLHRRIAKGCTPDIVFPGRRLAVFVDGDFWHGCPAHRPNRDPSGPNREMWRAKFEATKARDERANTIAEDAGWTVIRVWECEVRQDPVATARRVLDAAAPETA